MEEMKNIMIIVPHEDDEILMTAGIIEKAVSEGRKVTVVMAGNGDYEGWDKESGSVRLGETLEGLQVLGVGLDEVIFMGYADTGMDPIESFLYRLYTEQEEDAVHAGHCSSETYGRADKPDYHTARHGQAAAYTRKNFKEDLRDILRERKPDTVFTTGMDDLHGDHRGLFLFVKEVLQEEYPNGDGPVLFSTVVHSTAGDESWPLRESLRTFTCPEGFDEGSLKWKERISFPVPDSMLHSDYSKNKKVLALEKHRSALKEDAVDFLYSFIKSEELFWRIEYGIETANISN